MFCSLKKYADLVVWTKEDVLIERIYPDDEFWVDKVSRVKLFFENSILPELLIMFFFTTKRYFISSSRKPQ